MKKLMPIINHAHAEAVSAHGLPNNHGRWRAALRWKKQLPNTRRNMQSAIFRALPTGQVSESNRFQSNSGTTDPSGFMTAWFFPVLRLMQNHGKNTAYTLEHSLHRQNFSVKPDGLNPAFKKPCFTYRQWLFLEITCRCSKHEAEED